MKIKAIIVDTNPIEKDSINSVIEHFFNEEIEIIASVSCIKDAIKSILTLLPEIVFISDEMPVLEYLADNFDFEVVFLMTNASNDKLLHYSPLEYLQKPISQNNISDVIQKFRCKVRSDCKIKVETFVNNLSNDFELNKKLIFPTRAGYNIVKLCKILYCQGVINYTTIYTIDGKSFTVAVTLKKFEELLPDKSSSFTQKIYSEFKLYKKLDRDRNKLVFDNDIEIDISVRRIEGFIRAIISK